MRKAWIIGIVGIGLGFLAPSARAQNAGFSDPFFLYYGYFLPRQNALAAQGQPEDYYRARAIERQTAAQVDRSALSDANSAIGLDELDPLRPFGYRSASSRMVRTTPLGLPTTVSTRSHPAPREYFARHSTYYPMIRSGNTSSGSRGQGRVGSVGQSFISTPNPQALMRPPGLR